MTGTPNDLRQHLGQRYGSVDQGLVHRREMRILRRLLDRVASRQLECLDAPCGFGRLSATLRDALAPSLLVSADVNRQRLNALPDLPGLRVYAVSLDLFEAFPFADQSFDLALSIRFLQHVRRAEQRHHVLGELIRVARRFVIATYYDAGGLHGLLRAAGRRFGRRRGAPLTTVTPAAFADEVARLGGTVLADEAILPWVHAQRVALVGKASDA